MFESRISAGATEKLPRGKNLTQRRLRGPATWKDMLKNVSIRTVNWQTRKWSSCTKFQILAWMIINSNNNNSNQLEICQKFAHKLSQNACNWHEVDGLTSSGQSISPARSLTKWTQACDRRLASLSSYIDHTHEFRQTCHVDNTGSALSAGFIPRLRHCW